LATDSVSTDEIDNDKKYDADAVFASLSAIKSDDADEENSNDGEDNT
jgi:hypothetical protein